MVSAPVPHGLPPEVILTLVEVRGRKSANPLGAGKVVMSMTRNRSLVTDPPEVLVNLLLISSVPKVELFGGSLVKSRTRFGDTAAVTHGKISVAGKAAFLWSGLLRFWGPGAPSL